IRARVPLVSYMVRRLGSSAAPTALALLVDRLNRADNVRLQRNMVDGLVEALKGRRHVEMPAGWGDTFARLAKSGDADVRQQALALGVTFGDAKAFVEMRGIVLNTGAAPARRRSALAALLGAQDQELAPMLQKLVEDPDLRGPAL